MDPSSDPPPKQMLPDKATASDLREQLQRRNTSVTIDSDVTCARCKAKKSGRNLVVCFDGTSNQFGENNTNVVELYHRIIKDDDKKKQLTYYNSGIGTYARPSWRSAKYFKQVLTNKIDLAIAWNFETILLKGYRWLADHYEPGDQIFLFGFSRGAYQVRALAAMIEKVGLILPGNEEQIPFAYELYADLKSRKKKSKKTSTENLDKVVRFKEKLSRGHAKPQKTPTGTFDMAARFKETFSRKDVKVHFVGNWDAVSSIGLFRGKTLPEVENYKHICYFRHALALDERRVKFLPEYICGDESTIEGTSSQKAVLADAAVIGNGNTRVQAQNPNAIAAATAGVVPKSTVPRVKEVWFSGSHSDIGGGIVSNTELNNSAIPVLWMGNEASMAGLMLSPSRVERDWKKLETSTPTNSLSFIWRLFELLPFERLTYEDRKPPTNPPTSSFNFIWRYPPLKRLNNGDRKATTWWPHLARGRVIKPGQKIHASVAFVKYIPKATFADGMTDKNWSDIVEKGHYSSFDWLSRLGDLLEMDLFDLSATSELFNRLKFGEFRPDISSRLRFISLSEEGARNIMTADRDLEILLKMLDSDIAAIRIDSRDILAALAGYEFSFGPMENLVDSINLAVFPKLDQENSEVTLRESISVANLLRKLCEHPRLWDNTIKVGFDTLMALGNMAMNEESSTSLSAVQALKCVCGRARRTDAVLPVQYEIEKFTAARDEAVRIARAWMITLLIQSTEIRAISLEKVFSRIISMLRSRSYAVKASAAHLLANLGGNDAILTATSRDENIDLLCELLYNDPLEWTEGILSVFEAFTQRQTFRQALSGFNMVVHLTGMLASNTPASKVAEKLLGIFSEYREFERIIFGILPQLETMLQSDQSESRAMASRLLVEISRHKEMRSEAVTESIAQKLGNILECRLEYIQDEGLTVFAEITQYKEFHPVVSKVTQQLIASLKSDRRFKTVKQVFIQILKHKEVRSRILQTRGDIFQTLTDIHQSNSRKVLASCKLLEGILHYAEFRPAILKANVMPFLSSMLQSGEEELEEEAARMLSRFLLYDELRLAIVPTEFVPQLLTMLQEISGRLLAERRSKTIGWARRRTSPRGARPTLPHAQALQLEELGNGIHDSVMPWPPAVRPPSRLKERKGTMMKWEGLEGAGLRRRRRSLGRQAERPIINRGASLAGLLLGTMYQYDEFRPAILKAEVVPFLLKMWQHGILQSVVTATLSKFYEYNEFRAMIPPTEIVNQLVDLLQFHDERLIDELNALKILTKYPECRKAMLRRNMLTKLPVTIKHANLSEARVVVHLLGQCAQYDEFLNAKSHSNLASCLALCGVNMRGSAQRHRTNEEAASWFRLTIALIDIQDIARFASNMGLALVNKRNI